MNPEDDGAVKPHYLDASAIVLLLVREPGGEAVREFFNAETNFCSTPLCIAEALGVLKRKWPKILTTDEYFTAVQRLIIDAWSGRIRLDDLGMLEPSILRAVEAKAREHGLDMSDALQLETIKKGYFAAFVGGSAPVLITADDGLARAARTDGIRVWQCRTETRPSWLPITA
jgi:predicted nucleic acid-binding protein